MNSSDVPRERIRDHLAGRLSGVRGTIDAAARRAGRAPGSVRLLAVTKTVATPVLAVLHELGVAEFGENRAQETAARRDSLSGLSARWHMIGRLQTNKVRQAVALFDVIQSVDRDALQDALSSEAVRAGRTLDVLLQVNVSGEASKGGVSPAGLEGALERARTLPGLRVCGLMTVPAPVEDPEVARPGFRLLRTLRDRLRRSPDDLPELSMGMSHDYPVAVEEGATLVRIGTALFHGLPSSCFGRGVAAGAP